MDMQILLQHKYEDKINTVSSFCLVKNKAIYLGECQIVSFLNQQSTYHPDNTYTTVDSQYLKNLFFCKFLNATTDFAFSP